MSSHSPSFVFFGTPRRGVVILNKLKEGGLMPEVIVTSPDAPKGRGLKVAPPEAKIWAIENNIPFIQPKNLEDESFRKKITEKKWDFFLVVSFGKIMPLWLLKLPTAGSFNIHFSLLPRHRGATPVEAAILQGDKETGVSIVRMDEKIDHGPIIASEKMKIGDPLPTSFELVEHLSEIGGKLILETIPAFLDGRIIPKEQEHGKATYCKKITKEEAFIDLSGDPETNWRKIRAYFESPRPYFFAEKKGKKIRIVIRDAAYENGKLEIKRVIPEGRKEISYAQFLRS